MNRKEVRLAGQDNLSDHLKHLRFLKKFVMKIFAAQLFVLTTDNGEKFCLWVDFSFLISVQINYHKKNSRMDRVAYHHRNISCVF